MSRRRVQRVPYHLDSTGVRSLTPAEIAAILRGADTMIARGGRTQLTKLLKGSREASLVEHGLDRCPSYGFFCELTMDEILRRVDWVIEQEYLRIEYDYRLPVLIFTDRGWAIEVDTMAEELLRGFDARLTAGPPYDFSDLKDRNRQMIFLLLDRLEASGRRDFIPLLRAWSEIDYAKVRARIASVIRSLEGSRKANPGDPTLPFGVADHAAERGFVGPSERIVKIKRTPSPLEKKARRGHRGYPVATVAFYGPDESRASKVAVGIKPSEDSKVTELERWRSDSSDVRRDLRIGNEILELIRRHGVATIVMTDRIIGCPHEEGVDYPNDVVCPMCPYWQDRDRWSGEVLPEQ